MSLCVEPTQTSIPGTNFHVCSDHTLTTLIQRSYTTLRFWLCCKCFKWRWTSVAKCFRESFLEACFCLFLIRFAYFRSMTYSASLPAKRSLSYVVSALRYHALGSSGAQLAAGCNQNRVAFSLTVVSPFCEHGRAFLASQIHITDVVGAVTQPLPR